MTCAHCDAPAVHHRLIEGEYVRFCAACLLKEDKKT